MNKHSTDIAAREFKWVVGVVFPRRGQLTRCSYCCCAHGAGGEQAHSISLVTEDQQPLKVRAIFILFCCCGCCTIEPLRWFDPCTCDPPFVRWTGSGAAHPCRGPGCLTAIPGRGWQRRRRRKPLKPAWLILPAALLLQHQQREGQIGFAPVRRTKCCRRKDRVVVQWLICCQSR